ncbi:trigger factor [Candidatus Parcubacteria bacterium]|nr:trigger factor [Candidatus Parcubacteria bacterium]
MNSTSKKIADGQLELTVELSKEDLQIYVDQAEDSIVKDLAVDGFRKGKVPKNQLRNHVGGQAILEQALQLAIDGSLAKMLSEQKIDVYQASDLKVAENTPEKLVYSVKLTLFPEVQLSPLASVKVARQEVEVKPEEINETLETLRSSRAVLTDKEGPAEKGDRVEVDFEVKENGKTIEGGVSKSHPITIGHNHFIPGFEEQLVGMKKEGTKTFTLVAPKDFANTEVAGKSLEFEVTMHDVKKVMLPELTDEFAKTLGTFENLDQLKTNIKDGLRQEKEQKEHDRVRLAALDEIIKTSKITIPEPMIAQQLDSMIEGFDRDLHQREMELGMYLARIGKTQEDLKKEWKPEAERQVKIALTIRTIAKDNNIEVTPEEVDEALNGLVQSVMVRDATAAGKLDIDRMRSQIASSLQRDKTLDYLEKICTRSV